MDWFADLCEELESSKEPIAWAKPHAIYPNRKSWVTDNYWRVMGCPFCNGQHLHKIDGSWQKDQYIPVGVFVAGCDPSRSYRVFTWQARQGYVFRNSLSRKSVVGTLRSRVLAKTRGHCWYCGKKTIMLEVEHMTPVAMGGTNQLDNLVPACQECNSLKRDKTISQFRAKTGMSTFWGE